MENARANMIRWGSLSPAESTTLFPRGILFAAVIAALDIARRYLLSSACGAADKELPALDARLPLRGRSMTAEWRPARNSAALQVISIHNAEGGGFNSHCRLAQPRHLQGLLSTSLLIAEEWRYLRAATCLLTLSAR